MEVVQLVQLQAVGVLLLLLFDGRLVQGVQIKFKWIHLIFNVTEVGLHLDGVARRLTNTVHWADRHREREFGIYGRFLLLGSLVASPVGGRLGPSSARTGFSIVVSLTA